MPFKKRLYQGMCLKGVLKESIEHTLGAINIHPCGLRWAQKPYSLNIAFLMAPGCNLSPFKFMALFGLLRDFICLL